MTSPIGTVSVTSDPHQNSEALANISQADLIFYRNVELQMDLVQRYRVGILNLAIVAAEAVEGSADAIPQEAVEGIESRAASEKKSAHGRLEAAAHSIPSDSESAQQNLVNVVNATNLLMQNCISVIQALDELSVAVLGKSVQLILETDSDEPEQS